MFSSQTMEGTTGSSTMKQHNNHSTTVLGGDDDLYESSVKEMQYLLLHPPSSPSTATGSAQTQNPHQKVHMALQHLRDSGDTTFLFLRCFLGLLKGRFMNHTTTNSTGSKQNHHHDDDVTLLFHCVNGIRDTLLDKWDTLPKDQFLYIVRDFLLCLGIWGDSGYIFTSNGGGGGGGGAAIKSNNGGTTTTAPVMTINRLPNVISSALLSTSASFWKRCWLDIHHINIVGGNTIVSSNQNNNHQDELSFHPNILQMTNSIVQHIQSIVHDMEQNAKHYYYNHHQSNNVPALFQVFMEGSHDTTTSSIKPSIQLFKYLEYVIVTPIQEQQQQEQQENQITSTNNDPTTVTTTQHVAKLQSSYMGCKFLSNLLSEISRVPLTSPSSSSSSTTTSLTKNSNHNNNDSTEGTNHTSMTRYKQPLQFHHLVFQIFSSNNNNSSTSNNPSDDGLDAVLALCMRSLSSLVQYYIQINQQHSTTNNHNNVLFYDNIPLVNISTGIINLTTDVLSWDFESVVTSTTTCGQSMSFAMGAVNNNNNNSTDGNVKSVLIKPPARWRTHIIQPDFLSAIFTMYGIVRGQISARSSKNSNDGSGSSSRSLLSSFTSSSSSSQQPHQWKRSMSDLSHAIRQLLIELSSVSGSIYTSVDEQCAYAAFLVEGCLNSLTSILLYDDPNDDMFSSEWREGEAIDLCCMVCRLIINFKLPILVMLPSNNNNQDISNGNSFWCDGGIIYVMCTIGKQMCYQMLRLVEGCHGNINDYHDEVLWRQEAFNYILEGANLLFEDPWLIKNVGGPVNYALSNAFGTLYSTYVTCRIKINRIEEVYCIINADEEFDELREDISSNELTEQIISISVLGRCTNLLDALNCLLELMNDIVPKLQFMFESTVVTTTTTTSITSNATTSSTTTMSPETIAQLEHGRMVILCISYLLTDDIDGEVPMIPESICKSCQIDIRSTKAVGTLVQLCMTLAEHQASRICVTPNDPRLSPLLGKTLLWFLHRWSVSYILPQLDNYSSTLAGGATLQLGALSLWGTPESAQQAIIFCITLCLHYLCFWPLEYDITKCTCDLLLSLTKRKDDTFRSILINSTSWKQLVSIHIITSSLNHTSTNHEIKVTMEQHNDIVIANQLSIEMIIGYKRLPYYIRGNIFSAILIGCSTTTSATSSTDGNTNANDMLNQSLTSVHGPFTRLLDALQNRTLDPYDVRAQESVALAVEMYRGIAMSNDMYQSKRVPQFLSNHLLNISSLMTYYASDLTICERLLQLFCDYSERFILLITNYEYGIALFQSSSQLLHMYSTNHCNTTRTIIKPRKTDKIEHDTEEEQTYNDILCAIQLLLYLGTKDFVDMMRSNANNNTIGNINNNNNDVTNVIFHSIQDIIPLMTKGLLEYPILCNKFFYLLGYMMETYTYEACMLPYNLLRTILDTMLYGMCHSDTNIGRNCLMGIKCMIHEHIKNNSLHVHITQNEPQMFEQLTKRILTDVIFNTILIWDRIESSSSIILLLACVNMNQFVLVVNTLSQTLTNTEQQERFTKAFETLIQPDIVSRIQGNQLKGLEARKVFIEFKQKFELFVKEIHSFLIVNQ